jgi:hypothetical protein
VCALQATKPTFRLHIYVQLGTRRSSTGQGSSIVSEVRPAAAIFLGGSVQAHKPC